MCNRYRLDENLVHQETVLDITYGAVRGVSIDDEPLFTITTNRRTWRARTAVLAVGPANSPTIPPIPGLPDGARVPTPGGRFQSCHSFHVDRIPDPVVRARIAAGARTNVLVVGGGLTAAQIADLAVRRGVAKVWLFMRGPCKVKAFDVDLSWMGKYRNAEHARFWTADSDAERYKLFADARGGGSITSRYHARLKRHIAAGRLELRTFTKVTEAHFEDEGPGGGYWRVATDPPPGPAGLPRMDYVYFATGIQADFETLPYLQSLMESHPIHGHGGLPCINDRLMWRDDVPLYVAGRLAALQIGPASPNIGGAKLAAERIALAVDDFIGEGRGVVEGGLGAGAGAGAGAGVGDARHTALGRYASGFGSKYSCLEEDHR